MFRNLLATLALTVAVAGLAAGPADAASKHRSHKAKRPAVTKAVAKKRVAAKPAAPVAKAAAPVAKAAAPVATPVAPVATPVAPATGTVTSVTSIGGYVFYNMTYAEAVEAYFRAVAAAPPGYTPPPVTSISVDVTIGGTVG